MNHGTELVWVKRHRGITESKFVHNLTVDTHKRPVHNKDVFIPVSVILGGVGEVMRDYGKSALSMRRRNHRNGLLCLSLIGVVTSIPFSCINHKIDLG